jgi:hypothetical protein
VAILHIEPAAIVSERKCEGAGDECKANLDIPGLGMFYNVVYEFL